jgi:hypothetical protein
MTAKSKVFAAVMVALVCIVAPVFPRNSAKDVFNHLLHKATLPGYWIRVHGNYDYSRITEELNAFKTMGFKNHITFCK